jgi:hypothetical protein
MVLRDMQEPPKLSRIGRDFSLSVWKLVSVTLIFSANTSKPITHTEHHRGLVDVVFKSQKSEVIADLLHAWTTGSIPMNRHAHYSALCRAPRWSSQPGSILLKVAAARHTLRRAHRLQGIRGGRGGEVHWIAEPSPCHSRGYGQLAPMGKLLLDTLQTSEGAQHLSHWYWELLVELAILLSVRLRDLKFPTVHRS